MVMWKVNSKTDGKYHEKHSGIVHLNPAMTMRQHWVGSQVKWVLHWNSNWNPCYSPLQCGPAVVSAATGRRRNVTHFFFSTYITVFLPNSGKGFETRNDSNRVPSSLSIFHLYSKMLVMHFSSMNVKGGQRHWNS